MSKQSMPKDCRNILADNKWKLNSMLNDYKTSIVHHEEVNTRIYYIKL